MGGRQGRRPFLPPQVDQADLEAYDGAPPGKYTAGLGQKGIAFCDDSEDAVSMALTAVDRLLRSARVPVTDIGALHVGTESSPDRAKAVKTGLMRLFNDDGDGATDVGGVDVVAACYGGAAALFNAVNWVESRAWDGRFVSPKDQEGWWARWPPRRAPTTLFLSSFLPF